MSEHWLRKMRTYFKRIDVDKDGTITRHDFEEMANRFAKKATGGVDVLEKRITSVYDGFLGQATGGKPVDQETFIQVMKDHVGNESMKEKLQSPLPLLFKAVDTDQDGNISVPEYENFFEILGVDKTLAKESFKEIDENNDGLLSEDEFKKAGLDFFENQNETVFKTFLGPLVD